VLYEEWFHCTDLGVQLAPVISRFLASDCYASGQPADGEPAPPQLELDAARVLHDPIPLAHWVATHAAGPGHAVLYGEGAVEPSLREQEYTVHVFTRTVAGNAWCEAPGVRQPRGETFIYNMRGSGEVVLADTSASASGDAGAGAGAGAVTTFALGAGDVMLVPGGGRYAVRLAWHGDDNAALVVTNKVA
jgi:hypothetical protein